MSVPGRPGRRAISVRARTAAAACAALAVVLLVGGVGAVLFQRHELTNAVALVAEDQARTVLESDASPPELTSLSGGEGTLVQVVDGAGRVVAASPGLSGRTPLVGPPSGSAQRSIVSSVDQSEGDHYVAVAVPRTGTGGYVVAAVSLESVDAAVASTGGLFLVGSPVLLLVVGVLGYVLAGRALRPVERMRERAASITAADLSARLPHPAANDEVSRLADTMNAMLARLEASSITQRQFVADASHELRSPITTIRVLHEVATARADTDWVEVSHEVLGEVARLERLTADLLLLARADAGQRPRTEVVSIDAVVRREAERLRGVDVRCEADTGVLVDADPDMLARAVGNLLENAGRHARSAVTVRVRRQGPDRVEVSVEDDGAGIPEADLERVFERFVRLDDARDRDHGGAGLGLAIARGIAETHGGSLRAVVHPTGARLVLALPVAAGVQVAVSQPTAWSAS